jgi:hypothetical protein
MSDDIVELDLGVRPEAVVSGQATLPWPGSYSTPANKPSRGASPPSVPV